MVHIGVRICVQHNMHPSELIENALASELMAEIQRIIQGRNQHASNNCILGANKKKIPSKSINRNKELHFLLLFRPMRVPFLFLVSLLFLLPLAYCESSLMFNIKPDIPDKVSVELVRASMGQEAYNF